MGEKRSAPCFLAFLRFAVYFAAGGAAAAQTVIADKAYDAHARLIKPLLDKGKTVVIPSRATNRQPREHDRDLYKARHLIENFFFLGAVHLAAAMVWLA